MSPGNDGKHVTTKDTVANTPEMSQANNAAPTRKKIKTILKTCLTCDSMPDYIHKIIHIYDSGQVEPDVRNFQVLISIFDKFGWTKKKEDFQRRLDLLQHNAQSALDLPHKVTNTETPSPHVEQVIHQGPAPMAKNDPIDEVEEEHLPVSSEYLDQLNAIVEHPSGIPSMLITSKEALHWTLNLNKNTTTLRVNLRLSLNRVSDELEYLTKVITVENELGFRRTEDTREGSNLHIRLSNDAAKRCLELLHKTVMAIEAESKKILTRTLHRLFDLWKNEDYGNSGVLVFERAKKLILGEKYAALYGSKVMMYGSGTSGLRLPGSDVDIAIVLPKNNLPGAQTEHEGPQAPKKTEVLALVMNCVANVNMRDKQLIEHARVPVLRYQDPKGDVDVDITLGAEDPALLSRFFRRHLQVDKRVWQLCMAVKYWSKQRNVCGVPEGFINSMGWTIMAIFYLQHVCFPAIARLFWVQNGKDDMRVIVKVGWRSSSKDGKSDKKLPDLLTGFFRYFGQEHEFDKMAISMNCQDLAQAREMKSKNNSTLFIEQPLRPGVNIVGHLQPAKFELTLKELRKAYLSCVAGGDIDQICEERATSNPDDWMFDT